MVYLFREFWHILEKSQILELKVDIKEHQDDKNPQNHTPGEENQR